MGASRRETASFRSAIGPARTSSRRATVPSEWGRGSYVSGIARSRNGMIVLGPSAEVAGGLRTRNGAVAVERGARVGGDVTTRNGSVELTAAHVAGNIETHGGDIVLQGAEVDGDVILLMSEAWTGSLLRHTPVVRIDADSRVRGRVIVDDRAALEIARGADVSTVERHPARETWERRR
jgi:hypothetical protein